MKGYTIAIGVVLAGITLLLIASGNRWSVSKFAPFQNGCLQYSVVQRKGYCSWRFMDYQPSAWEQDWMTNLEDRKMKVCELIYKGDNLKNSIAWVSRNIELMSNNVGAEFEYQSKSDDLYSRMIYEFSCSDQADEESLKMNGAKMEMMIEPLVGNTRDPFTICPSMPSEVPDAVGNRQGWDSVQSKRHLLMGPYSPIRFQRPSDSTWTSWTLDRAAVLPDTATLPVLQGRRIILFDLGAALYGSWLQGALDAASTKFFVDNFQMRRGINFTHIYAFEYTVNKPSDVWGQVPKEIVPYYHYINVGVESKIDGHYNPFTILQQIATPQDFVVIKLDIDSPHIENPLVEQLVNTPSLLELVDEMTYEHHVHTPEMLRYWGNLPIDLTLTQTYSYFTRLRKAGVRMHSWP